MKRTILVVFMVLAGACSGASAATHTAYAATATDCIRRERIIVERQGTTEAQDRADLAAERARCDAALAAVEHGGQ